jgi:hypothetical protein
MSGAHHHGRSRAFRMLLGAGEPKRTGGHPDQAYWADLLGHISGVRGRYPAGLGHRVRWPNRAHGTDADEGGILIGRGGSADTPL